METQSEDFLRSESIAKRNVEINLIEKVEQGSRVIEINNGLNIYSVFIDKVFFRENFSALMNFIADIDYEASVEAIDQTIHSFLIKRWRVNYIKSLK